MTRAHAAPPPAISAVPVFLLVEISDDLALDLYYWTAARRVEERALNLYRQGKLPGSYYTGRGQEAIAVGIALPLCVQGRRLALALDPPPMATSSTACPWPYFAQFMGKAGSTTRGKDGNLHIGGREWSIPCQVSHMADTAPLTVGAALASSAARGGWRSRASATRPPRAGDFHEGLNIAAAPRRPPCSLPRTTAGATRRRSRSRPR